MHVRVLSCILYTSEDHTDFLKIGTKKKLLFKMHTRYTYFFVQTFEGLLHHPKVRSKFIRARIFRSSE